MVTTQETIKKTWHWIWNSDSPYSWIVALILIYLFVKFIFFPVLSLVLWTDLPLAGVESSSMDHQIVREGGGIANLCGISFSRNERQWIEPEEYWQLCGDWYEQQGISQNQFESFPLHTGFSKGDILIVTGWITPEIGDIIIFTPNTESRAPRPIVHRIVTINEDTYQTKGDHNKEQLTIDNNVFRTDETTIQRERVIGTVILRIPALGWIKIWLVDILNIFVK